MCLDERAAPRSIRARGALQLEVERNDDAAFGGPAVAERWLEAGGAGGLERGGVERIVAAASVEACFHDAAVGADSDFHFDHAFLTKPDRARGVRWRGGVRNGDAPAGAGAGRSGVGFNRVRLPVWLVGGMHRTGRLVV